MFMTWHGIVENQKKYLLSECKFTTADFWIKNRPITHGVQNFEMEIKLLQLHGFTYKAAARQLFFGGISVTKKTTNYASRYGGGVT